MARWTPGRRWSLLLALVLAVTVCTTVPATAAKPRKPTALFVDPGAVKAPADGPYAGWRQVPQALWFSESVPTATVRSAVAGYVGRAVVAKARPVLVLYAIPGRDCGSYSAGGFPDAVSYRRWVDQVAKGLYRSSALVILEPDALASAGTCGGASRLSLLRWATKRLARSGAWIYLDAGHSNWQPSSVMTARLRAAGVRWARGVSLNVSNYRSTAAERRFGASLLHGLRGAGIKGKHLVVDTSRNGAKPRSSEWCNPIWARVGPRPRLFRKGVVDGYLWIKHPGESDGTCNGGPTAGAWSDLLAGRLTGRAA